MTKHLEIRGLATWMGLVALLLVSAGLAIALADGSEPASRPAETTRPVVRTELAVSPVYKEIRDLHEAAKARQDEFEAGLATALDSRRALEIQRQIQDLKSETEVEMLRIQHRHAELRGDTAAAAFLATAVRRIRDPEAFLAEIAEPVGSEDARGTP